MSSEDDKQLSAESLMDEYGLDSETAERLAKELPDFMKKDDDKDEPAPEPTPEPAAEPEPEKPAPETEPEKEEDKPPEEPKSEMPDQEENKGPTVAEVTEKVKAALTQAGLSPDEIRKVLESLATDEADAAPIQVEKGLYDKLRRKLLRAGVKKEVIPTVMEAISVDVMEPISVDKEFMKKLKQILKAAKLPKEMQVLVMEPISVDALDSCDVVMDSLDFTLDAESLSTADGVLKGHAVCASAMVQDYSGIKMLKCPDELKLAVQFARMLPITDGHPPSALVRDQKEIKGFTGLLSWNDETRSIECDFEIFDSALIDKVNAGKHDVSIGFTCEIEQKQGKFTRDGNEETYDAIQRNIVLNHLAAGIEKGRCPHPICGIKSDAAPPPPTPPGEPDPLKAPGRGDPIPISKELAAKVMKFHNITPEDWEKLTEAERQRLTEEYKAKYPDVPPKAKEAYPYPYPMKKDELDELAKAQEILAQEKAKLIDSIMDHNPPKTRAYYEGLNMIVLKDINDALALSKGAEGLPFSDSSKPGNEAINDAYARIHRKSP